MTDPTEPQTVFFVWGPKPDDDGNEPVGTLEIFLDERDAEAWLVSGVMASADNWTRYLRAGGTFSLYINRGTRDDYEEGGDEEKVMMTASLALTNPGKERRVRDYFLQRRVAAALPTRREP